MNAHLISRVVKPVAKPKSIVVFKGLVYDMNSKSLQGGRHSVEIKDETLKQEKNLRTVFQTPSGQRMTRQRQSTVNQTDIDLFQPNQALQNRPLRRAYEIMSNGTSSVSNQNGSYGSCMSINSVGQASTMSQLHDFESGHGRPSPRKSVFCRPVGPIDMHKPTESKVPKYNHNASPPGNDRRQSCISVLTDRAQTPCSIKNGRRDQVRSPTLSHMNGRNSVMSMSTIHHSRMGTMSPNRRTSVISTMSRSTINQSRMGTRSPNRLSPLYAPSITIGHHSEEEDGTESVISSRHNKTSVIAVYDEFNKTSKKRISTYIASDHDITKKNVQMRFPEMIPIWQNVTRLYLCKVNLQELPEDFGTLKVIRCFYHESYNIIACF